MLKKANLSVDVVENELLNTLTKNTNIPFLVQRMEELLQVQKTIVRNTTFKNEQLQVFTRLEEAYTGLFYNVNERYNQVSGQFTSRVARLEEQIEKLEEQKYELWKENDTLKQIKETGKRELEI